MICILPICSRFFADTDPVKYKVVCAFGEPGRWFVGTSCRRLCPGMIACCFLAITGSGKKNTRNKREMNEVTVHCSRI